MASSNVIRADEAHINRVASLMREADRQEVWAFRRVRPREALEMSLALADIAYTVVAPDTLEPIAMFGVGTASLISDIGNPWLLGTDEIIKWRLPFAKHSRFYVRKMLDLYGVLENFVDARNTISKAWLRWCGFKIYPAENMGHEDRPFHRVELRRQ